jgi:hypothetical protein
MERELSVERLYFLGNYRNIKFSNLLKGIPEHIAKSDRATSLLFFQQALACEIAYRKYYEIVESIAKEEIQDAVGYLEKKREQTLEELLEEINKLDNEKIANDYGKKE